MTEFPPEDEMLDTCRVQMALEPRSFVSVYFQGSFLVTPGRISSDVSETY